MKCVHSWCAHVFQMSVFPLGAWWLTVWPGCALCCSQCHCSLCPTHPRWVTWTGRRAKETAVKHIGVPVPFIYAKRKSSMSKTSVFLLQSGTADPPAPPHFDSRSRIFELDSCGGNGKVCLVYKNCTPGVLFLLLQFYFKKYAKPLSAFSPFRNVSSRCRSPAEWSLVPRSLAVLALPDVHVHLLLQTDDHTPRPARVAVRLHPVRAQPSGQGSKAEHADLRVVNQSVFLKCDSLVHEMFFLEPAVQYSIRTHIKYSRDTGMKKICRIY